MDNYLKSTVLTERLIFVYNSIKDVVTEMDDIQPDYGTCESIDNIVDELFNMMIEVQVLQRRNDHFQAQVTRLQREEMDDELGI